MPAQGETLQIDDRYRYVDLGKMTECLLPSGRPMLQKLGPTKVIKLRDGPATADPGTEADIFRSRPVDPARV